MLALRDLLAEVGLPSWVKTSGSKGFHVVVPLDGRAEIRSGCALRSRAGDVARARDDKHLTQEFSKADRRGRIYVDTGRNGYSATVAAALRRSRTSRGSGFGAMHMGRNRARRHYTSTVHIEEHAAANRSCGRCVGGRCMRSPQSLDRPWRRVRALESVR